MNKSKSFCEPHDADLMVLIKMVEERPCLWDKSSLKAPGERKQAWREISRHFAPVDFDDMDPAEQSKLGNFLSRKWKNQRDTFVRLFKHNAIEKYKFYENTKFLMKNFDVEQQLTESPGKENENHTLSHPRHAERLSSSFQINLAHKRKKRSSAIANSTKGTSQDLTVEELQIDVVTPDSETNDVKSTSELPQENRILDEDEAFFISIMPNVKKLSDEDKLEFRMSVLNTIREISQKSKMNMSSNKPSNNFYFVTHDDSPNPS